MATEVRATSLPMTIHKPDNLAIAEENLLAKAASLEKQLGQVKKMIDNLRDLRTTGTGEPLIPPVKPDEYKGMRAVDALETYLRARRGMRISLSRAVADLVMGGVDPGQARGRKNDPRSLVAHTLKISLPNKHQIFSWDPVVSTKKDLPGVPKGQEITIWLAESADEPKRRKRARG